MGDSSSDEDVFEDASDQFCDSFETLSVAQSQGPWRPSVKPHSTHPPEHSIIEPLYGRSQPGPPGGPPHGRVGYWYPGTPYSAYPQEPHSAYAAHTITPRESFFEPQDWCRDRYHEPRPPSSGVMEPSAVANELSRLVLRRELVQMRLSPFSDKPEQFPAWQDGFLSVVRELMVSPREELDLLIKNLGQESKPAAEALRAANHYDPQRGLTLVWDMLTRRYGHPEHLEQALQSIISKIAKYKVPRDLYTLSTLVIEIQSAKRNTCTDQCWGILTLQPE